MLDIRLNRRTFTLSAAFAMASLKGVSSAAQESGIYTFAVLGLDVHTGGGSQRSDTIMLSRVNLNEHTVRTLSIPRDLYVEIPGYGFAKINHGYQHGLEMDPELKWQSGADSVVATITHNFGMEIDGVAVLEFKRMAEVIDAIGGIEVDNPYEVNDAGYHYPAGPIELHGEDAVFYVRTRNQDGDGGRVMRQQLVLAAMLERLQQPEILPSIPGLVEALSDTVHTDINAGLQLRLIAAIPSIRQENLAFTNIEEFLWSDYTESGAWIYRGDWSTLPQYVQTWLNGEID